MSSAVIRILKEGDKAPDFTAKTDDGATMTLKSLRGKWVVLFFYPRDNTPTCTVEACEFRDAWDEIVDAGVVVLGVSPDSVTSHARFRKKFKLPYQLVADEGHTIAERYGVWGMKVLFGLHYPGIIRTTFVIDPRGVISRRFDKVRAKGHAVEVLATIAG